MAIIHIDDFTSRRDPANDILRLFFHSREMTLVFLHAPAGALVAPHRHAAEQFTVPLEGVIEMTLGHETHRLTPGWIAQIPANALHASRALEDSVLIEIFSPPRTDFA